MPYIGKQPVIGEFVELDALTASATDTYTLTRNSVAYYPETVNNLLVSINGVIQAGSTMSLNGNTLTVGATLSSSDVIDFVRVFGNVGNVVTPTDGSVTDVKIDSMSASKLTGALPASSFPSGSIIQTQVHQEFGQADFGVAGTAGDDALMNAARASDSSTKVEVAITPTSASSKILVTVNLFYEWSGAGNEHELLFLLYRDATRLGAPRQGNRRGGISPVTISYYADDYSSTPASVHFQYYDTPNSTSALTYTVAFNCSVTGSDYVRLNTSVVGTNSIAFEDGMSIITVQEIAQ